MISIYENNFGIEAFVAIDAETGVNFSDALEGLLTSYDATLAEKGLGRDSVVLMRFHVSDAHTQAAELFRKLKDFRDDALVSVVQQPPASGSKVALEAYHISTNGEDLTRDSNELGLLVRHGPYQSLWGELLPDRTNCSSHDQTEGILNALSGVMENKSGTVRNNVIRTWFYVRDIDNNYAGLVDARREWFADVGMTADTHYIASTGIEGSVEKTSDLVMLNYLAILGLNKQQVHYMSSLDNLCPTHDYGVTFERGTRVMFGDRSHYYISGTASIDNKGDVLYEGDVIRQTQRTIENISALMKECNASFEDMKMIVVYLRDSSDYQQVDAYLKQHMPESTAYIIVEGAVCRTTWLIEMDGVGITGDSDERFAPFC
jgi:enamine deaminase RidA (YjgF/YER057c/UK114 family)